MFFRFSDNTVYCPSCGEEIIEDADYCHNCGTESPDLDQDKVESGNSEIDEDEVKGAAKELQNLLQDNPDIFDQLSPTEQTIIEELGLKPEK